MPNFQMMLERANAKLSYSSKDKPSWTSFPEGDEKEKVNDKLGPLLRAIDIAKNGNDQETADKMPFALAEALKATLRANLKRDTPFGMQFIWFESAGWNLEISESGPGTGGSVGAISVVIRSPKNPANIEA